MTTSRFGAATGLLDAFDARHKEALLSLSLRLEAFTKASRMVHRAWSGSFAGWHGRMYYKGFQEPPVQRRFNGEWGGVHGIPDGWEERTSDQVDAYVNGLVGDGFDVKAFDGTVKAVNADLPEVREDILVQLAAVKAMPESRSALLLTELRTEKVGEWRVDYINAGLLGGLWSRDTEALRQGICLPSWLYYDAVVDEARHILAWVRDTRKKFQRLTELLAIESGDSERSKEAEDVFGLSIHPDIRKKCESLYRSGSYAEAVEKSFKVVRDRLRVLTGYETGSEAFGKGKLFINGAAAANVEDNFNQAVKFLTMAIDMFRNEKAHTSDAHIDNPVRALQYLAMSSLALSLLENAEVRQ